LSTDGKDSVGSGDNIVHFRRILRNCTYLYVVGEKNAENGMHNFKVGIAKNLNSRKIFYQSHSPNKIQFYFFQSCFDFGFPRNAGSYEDSIHSLIKRYLGMIHQDWCRITLDNLISIIKNHLKNMNQPIYHTIKYRDNSEIYIPIKTINKNTSPKRFYFKSDHGDSDHIVINEYTFELSFLSGGRYGTDNERESRTKLIKKFKNINSLYEYFYKNFDKITSPKMTILK